MKITDVRVSILENAGSAKAMASITFDDALVVKGFKLMEGQKGLFVSMPSRKKQDGEYEDTCFAKDKDLRQELNDAVISKYKSQANFVK